MTWQVVSGLDWPGTQHVLPVNDLRDHNADQRCHCHPRQDTEEPRVWIHNALDQRERYETGELKPQ